MKLKILKNFKCLKLRIYINLNFQGNSNSAFQNSEQKRHFKRSVPVNQSETKAVRKFLLCFHMNNFFRKIPICDEDRGKKSRDVVTIIPIIIAKRYWKKMKRPLRYSTQIREFAPSYIIAVKQGV